MIHIVFQEADVQALQKSFELDPSMEGDILQIKDEFAVGPIADIYSAEGIESRKNWWRSILAGGDYNDLPDEGTVNDQQTVEGLLTRMQENANEVVWIWAAQNKHDVSGYYWLISQLKSYQGRIFLLYLNNLPFINEKGSIFYPENLFNIPPREFVKAKSWRGRLL